MKTVTSAADDDDWETDPDFVVSTYNTVLYKICLHTLMCLCSVMLVH